MDLINPIPLPMPWFPIRRLGLNVIIQQPLLAAVLSSDMDNTDKVAIFIDECRRMKLTILPPDIHESFL